MDGYGCLSMYAKPKSRIVMLWIDSYTIIYPLFLAEKAVNSIFNNKYQVKHKIKAYYSVLDHQY